MSDATMSNPLEGARVLLLEDEFMIALDAQEILSELGAREVCVAANLDDAAKLAAGDRFDVAILDVNINGQTSFQLAEELQKTGVPVVFATGYELRDRVTNTQETVRVGKPYTPERLFEALKTAMHCSAAGVVT